MQYLPLLAWFLLYRRTCSYSLPPSMYHTQDLLLGQHHVQNHGGPGFSCYETQLEFGPVSAAASFEALKFCSLHSAGAVHCSRDFHEFCASAASEERLDGPVDLTGLIRQGRLRLCLRHDGANNALEQGSVGKWQVHTFPGSWYQHFSIHAPACGWKRVARHLMLVCQDCGVMYYLSPAAGTGWHTYKYLGQLRPGNLMKPLRGSLRFCTPRYLLGQPPHG